jgi:DNA-binding response OmpR family regulator
LRSGPLYLDLAARTVKIGEQPLELAPQEFALLRYLIQHPGRALSRDQLLNAVWGPLYQGGARTVDIHVRRLRAQLGDSARQLATVRGLGYRWSS